MGYYDALIAKWPSAPAGTTQSKIDWINAQILTGQIPATFFPAGNQILNCIVWTEFKALTADKQTNLLQMLTVPGQLLGGSANTAFIVDGMMIDYFTAGSQTIANLTALAKAATIPWWQATVAQGGGGLSSPVSQADCSACVPPLV